MLFFLSLPAVCAILTAMELRILMPHLKRLAPQPIYEEGPSWHTKKRGTPTMGGLSFIIAISLIIIPASIILFTNPTTREVGISLIILIVFTLLNAVIGLVDDITKLKRRDNKGLGALQKLALQSIPAIFLLISRAIFFQDTTAVSLFNFRLDLGLFYYPLSFILILAMVNFANLTDGIDGLASSVGLTVALFFSLLSYFLSPAALLPSLLLLGGCIGFLFFNRHPAKIFMGDTGSLFLGGMAVALAFSIGMPYIIIFVGGIFVIEGLSVILQVAFFKLFKFRLFKMAPLHHHFERLNFSENQICLVFSFVNAIFSILSLWIFNIEI